MDKKQERWAIFWCDLLSEVHLRGNRTRRRSISFSKQRPTNKSSSQTDVSANHRFSTLRRKLNRYRNGGFDALARKGRGDRGKPRNIATGIIDKAVELKKEQPRRSSATINRFLEEIYGATVPRSTLYRHLKQAGATRVKLGVLQKKVRKRWTRNHTHDLWVGDFEDGPYVMNNTDVVPTHLSAFIDCHSRFCCRSSLLL